MSNIRILQSKEQILNFYNTEDFINRNLIEDFANENNNTTTLLKNMLNGFHIGVFTEDKVLYALTQCKPLSDKQLEVHTYVLPEYRNLATGALSSSMTMVKTFGIKKLVTYSNRQVRPFLIKKLGFTEANKVECKGHIFYTLEKYL